MVVAATTHKRRCEIISLWLMVELRRSTRNQKVTKPTKAPKAKAPKAAPKKESKQETMSIEVGDKIPDLTLLDEDENEINLVEASKKTKYVIIFAYPKASTPGCTRQVCGFQKNLQDLEGLDVTVFGLSADLPKAQKNFVIKQGLSYHLLSDPEKQLITPLGARKEPTGIKRSHWVFEDGVLKIKKIQISPEDSFQKAIDDIKSLL